MNTNEKSNARMQRALLSLEGLSVGDAFGGRFNFTTKIDRVLPAAPWYYSDDTEMALGIVEALGRNEVIERDVLAEIFTRRYQADPYRGYGLSARRVLQRMVEGTPWRIAASEIYEGAGSMGNGGAMRVAPLGAYFAEDLNEVVAQAQSSAEVTHHHPEGQAGAIATAIAAAWACAARDRGSLSDGRQLLECAWSYTPEGATRDGLSRALSLDFASTIEEAVSLLGNGSRITSPDTVPFALWCAARHLHDYVEALWATVSAGGDNDTNCAIVGGIVVLANGPQAIPESWIAAREPLGQASYR